MSIWKNPNPWAYTIIGGIIVAVIAGLILKVTSSPTPSPTPTPTPGSKTPGTTPTATASATPPPVVGGIYHQGALAVAFNTCVDLDAPPSDPQWGEVSNSQRTSAVDLCSAYPYFIGGENSTFVVVNSGTNGTCQNATGWTSTDQDLGLHIGSFVCVHTSEGRYSLLRVTAIDSGTNTTTFWVKTFKKPGDQ